MPGPGTHVLVSDQVVRQLSDIKRWPYASKESGPNSISPTQLADIASGHQNYYALGAVGPDLFFFLPDFRNHLTSPLIWWPPSCNREPGEIYLCCSNWCWLRLRVQRNPHRRRQAAHQPVVTVASRQQAFYSRWLRANQLDTNRLHC
jgi:hypothetical protein